MDYQVIKEMEQVEAQIYFKQVHNLITQGDLNKMKEFTLNHLDEMPNIINYTTHNRANWHFDIIQCLLVNKPHLHTISQWLKYFHEDLNISFLSFQDRNSHNNILQFLLSECNHNDISGLEEKIHDAFQYLLNTVDLNHIKNNHHIATLVWQSKPKVRQLILPLLKENAQYQQQMEEGLNKKGRYQNNPLLFEFLDSSFSSSYENFIEFYEKYENQIDLTMHGSSENYNIFFTITNGVRNKKSFDLFALITKLIKKQNRLDLFYEFNSENESIISNFTTFLMLQSEEEIQKNFNFLIENFSNLTPLIEHKQKEESIYEQVKEHYFFQRKHREQMIVLNYLDIILEKEKLENSVQVNNKIIDAKLKL